MNVKKILILLIFLIIGVVFLISNTTYATTIEYLDTVTNLKYLLDEETKTASVIGYENLIAANITIPSKIENSGYEYTVTKIGDLAFLQCDTIESITIPKTVTLIGEKVFNGADNLKEIKVEEGNATYSSVDGVLFNYDKTELIRYPEGKNETTYTIPDTVTQIVGLGFWHNQNLKEIQLPDSIGKIGGNAFQFCTSLESIELPEKVSIIEGFTFDGCSSLSEVIINGSITKIGEYAFNGCTSLTNFNISDSVVYIGRNAFYDTILENQIINVTNSLSDVSSSNIKNFIKIDENSYETKLIPNEGYKLPQNISIKINGIDLASNDYEYDYLTGDLKIPMDKVDGDIYIEVVGIKKHKLVFNPNEGKFSSQKTILEFKDAEEFDFNKLEIPTREGYKFIGYYTKKGTSLYDVMNSEAGIETDITFYAKWEENSKSEEAPIPEEDKQVEENNKTDNTNENINNNTTVASGNPKTGDNIALYITVLIISIVGITTIIKLHKIRNM